MNERVKILILGKMPPPYYGVSVWFEQLQKGEWPDHFQMLWYDTGIHKDISTIGNIGALSVFKHMMLHLKFFLLLFREKPDLVLVPVSQSKFGIIKDSVYIILARLFKAKVLVMLHGSNLKTYLKSSTKLFNRYFNFIMAQCYGAIVLSDRLKYIFSDYFDSSRIFSVPNGIDINLSQLEQKTSNSSPVVCYLGNLLLSKGIEDILNALVFLKNQQVDFKALFIGGWGDQQTEEKCKQIVADNELNVQFTGVKTGIEKYQLLKNSDIFLFTPNKPEGLPYVVLEAMSVGLPIIATDQGSITDAVVDSENGFIVESGNAESIVQAISKLLHKRDLIPLMGEKSKRIYKNKFTKNHMISRFVSTFETVINKS